MHKSGNVFSGLKKVQRWRCNQCGRTTTKVEQDCKPPESKKGVE